MADAHRFLDAPRRATAPGAFMPLVYDADGQMSFLSAAPHVTSPEEAVSVMVPAVPTHIAAIESAGTPHGSMFGDDGDVVCCNGEHSDSAVSTLASAHTACCLLFLEPH